MFDMLKFAILGFERVMKNKYVTVLQYEPSRPNSRHVF